MLKSMDNCKLQMPIKVPTPWVPYTLKIVFFNKNTHFDPYFTTIAHMFPGVTKIKNVKFS